MTEDRLRRDFKLNLFLFSSLSSLIAKDVLAACEITAAQSSSLDCANGKMKMVNPDSIVNRTCSILNDTTTPGTTWREVNNTLKPKAGLILKSGNSITRIYLRLAVHLIFSTTSVRTLYAGSTLRLRCHVSGTPIPSVLWFKDGKLITNSAEGFYHTEKLSEFEPDTLEATVHVPGREENEGFYNCTAKNSICGLSSKTSTEIQVQYNCPPPKEIQPADSSDIHSTVSSNITLTCLVRMNEEILKHCNFTWYFNNTKLQVQTDDKYKTELKANHSKCGKEFSLTVTNVTFYDEGEYSCHQICYYGRSKANISLHVYQKQGAMIFVSTPRGLDCMGCSVSDEVDVLMSNGDTSPTSGNKITSAHPTTTNQGGRKRKWIIPIISASTCGVFLLITAVLIRFMKKKWAYKKMKSGCAEDGVTSNKLFISYSSKDVSWVTENLIFLLEKHSIPYSIHTRDFELGKPIVQNMADSVYNSRQVLIVLSDNYLASNFCREELHMAIQRGVDTGDSSVVLVLIDNFNKKRLPCALGNKVLLDFKKHKKQQDWEEKLLKVVLGAKTFSL